MSRKKIRTRRKNKSISLNSMPGAFDQDLGTDTSGFSTFTTTRFLSEKESSFMPLYMKAHQLMPMPTINPNAPYSCDYQVYLSDAVRVLSNADSSSPVEDILRALGILGHTPDKQSISALSTFADSDHMLAPVANLALTECYELVSMSTRSGLAS